MDSEPPDNLSLKSIWAHIKAMNTKIQGITWVSEIETFLFAGFVTQE